ncbi:MAG: hypothetical protein HC767_14230, partial [Akkermansiaceae bacterium]|nr:hypothetical protein [Akkermansiaceae bacterium]
SWAEKHGEATGEATPLGDLMLAIRKKRVDPFVGRRIGKYIQSSRLETDVNFLSAETNRYRYRLVIDEAAKAESKLFKRLAFEVSFPLTAVEAARAQRQPNAAAAVGGSGREIHFPESNRWAGFQLLPGDTAGEIACAPDERTRARLICDFLAGMTDGYAARTYKRLFSPDFGSIGDLVG